MLCELLCSFFSLLYLSTLKKIKQCIYVPVIYNPCSHSLPKEKNSVCSRVVLSDSKPTAGHLLENFLAEHYFLIPLGQSSDAFPQNNDQYSHSSIFSSYSLCLLLLSCYDNNESKKNSLMYKCKTLINSFSVDQNYYLVSRKRIRIFHSDQKLEKKKLRLLTYVNA